MAAPSRGTGLSAAIDASRAGSTLVFGGRRQLSVEPMIVTGGVGVSARLALP